MVAPSHPPTPACSPSAEVLDHHQVFARRPARVEDAPPIGGDAQPCRACRFARCRASRAVDPAPSWHSSGGGSVASGPLWLACRHVEVGNALLAHRMPKRPATHPMTVRSSPPAVGFARSGPSSSLACSRGSDRPGSRRDRSLPRPSDALPRRVRWRRVGRWIYFASNPAFTSAPGRPPTSPGASPPACRPGRWLRRKPTAGPRSATRTCCARPSPWPSGRARRPTSA